MINLNLPNFTKMFTIKFVITLILLSLIFSFSISKTTLYAQAPMTVFGVAASAAATVQILVNDQDCKDAKILVEPNSSTGYIFLAYIDEGAGSAFQDSKLSFKVNDKLAKETILWRKGGAPSATTGLVLTTGAQPSSSTNNASEEATTSSTKKQSYPALPGPPEKPKSEEEVKKNNATVAENKNNNEVKKEESAMTKDSKAESTAKIQSNSGKTKEQTTTVSKPMNEEKTIIKTSDDGSSNRVIIISGLVTLLVLFSFYSLASRR